jgi:hypothetical protein
MCLYCDENGKQFQSKDAVRKHMISKSHCKIPYEVDGLDEDLEGFYDFSSRYVSRVVYIPRLCVSLEYCYFIVIWFSDYLEPLADI